MLSETGYKSIYILLTALWDVKRELSSLLLVQSLNQCFLLTPAAIQWAFWSGLGFCLCLGWITCLSVYNRCWNDFITCFSVYCFTLETTLRWYHNLFLTSLTFCVVFVFLWTLKKSRKVFLFQSDWGFGCFLGFFWEQNQKNTSHVVFWDLKFHVLLS